MYQICYASGASAVWLSAGVGPLPVLLLLLLLMLLWLLLLLLLIKVEDVCKHFGSRDIVTADSNGRQLGPGFWETGAAGVAMGTRKTLVQIGAG
jgi:hypothetical protein